jgi:K+-transporting ATPase ATPase C chain
MIKQIRTLLVLFGILTLITGLIYPLVITIIAQIVFPYQANGSLINYDRKYVGSELIGQQFDQPQYFWGRLSATSDHPYNASASGGSNYSVMNPRLEEATAGRVAALKAADPQGNELIPIDLVTASGSGLDPHISIAAARYQAERVAKARVLSLNQVQNLIDKYTEGRQFGFLGEPRVNVLELNLALDAIK